MSAPEEVVELARARLAARAQKDWALADQLRNKIAEHGFEVLDVADGFEFKLKSPFPIVSRIGDLRKFSDKSFESAIAIIADGFIEDLISSVRTIKEYAPQSCAILILISGKPEMSGLAAQLDSRTIDRKLVRIAQRNVVLDGAALAMTACTSGKKLRSKHRT